MEKLIEEKDGMIIEWDVPIVMSDGTTMRADIFRPPTPGKCPAILTYSPYANSLLPVSLGTCCLNGKFLLVLLKVAGPLLERRCFCTFQPYRPKPLWIEACTPDTSDTSALTIPATI